MASAATFCPAALVPEVDASSFGLILDFEGFFSGLGLALTSGQALAGLL